MRRAYRHRNQFIKFIDSSPLSNFNILIVLSNRNCGLGDLVQRQGDPTIYRLARECHQFEDHDGVSVLWEAVAIPEFIESDESGLT